MTIYQSIYFLKPVDQLAHKNSTSRKLKKKTLNPYQEEVDSIKRNQTTKKQTDMNKRSSHWRTLRKKDDFVGTNPQVEMSRTYPKYYANQTIEKFIEVDGIMEKVNYCF